MDGAFGGALAHADAVKRPHHEARPPAAPHTAARGLRRPRRRPYRPYPPRQVKPDLRVVSRISINPARAIVSAFVRPGCAVRPIQTLKTRFDAARGHDAGDLRGARAALLALANDRAVAGDDGLPAGALDHALAAVQARLGHAGDRRLRPGGNRQRRRALWPGARHFPTCAPRWVNGPRAAAVATWRRLPMALDEPVSCWAGRSRTAPLDRPPGRPSGRAADPEPA